MSRVKPVAVVDVDDTLTIFRSAYLSWARARLPDTPDEDLWSDARINEFVREAHPSVFTPTPGSQGAIERIANEYRVLAVSARDDDLHDYTVRLLDYHFSGSFSRDDVIHVGHSNGTPLACKLETVVASGFEPAFIVEDRFATAATYAQAGIRAFHIGRIPTEGLGASEYLTSFPTHAEAWRAIPGLVSGRR